eukprot:COSAG05_NODE_142_length_16591_cov_6.726837_7_plen_55_part_00
MNFQKTFHFRVDFGHLASGVIYYTTAALYIYNKNDCHDLRVKNRSVQYLYLTII